MDYVKGIFKNRPNRFIAEVEIDGKIEIAHVPNTGRCRELLVDDAVVWLKPSDNPNRKTKFSLHFVENKNVLVSLYSQQANSIVYDAIVDGKIKELSAFPENDYTDEGNLLGHIYMGAEMIDIQVRKIEGFPKTLANEVKHCILAHHGEMEYGSPKVPALIEAMALSFADDTDAKLRRFSDLLADAPDDEWSKGSDHFLNSKFRKTII